MLWLTYSRFLSVRVKFIKRSADGAMQYFVVWLLLWVVILSLPDGLASGPYQQPKHYAFCCLQGSLGTLQCIHSLTDRKLTLPDFTKGATQYFSPHSELICDSLVLCGGTVEFLVKTAMAWIFKKKRLHFISLSILFGESVQINKLQFGRFLGQKFWSTGTCLWPEKGLTAPQSEANISCYEGYEFAWKFKIWTSY